MNNHFKLILLILVMLLSPVLGIILSNMHIFILSKLIMLSSVQKLMITLFSVISIYICGALAYFFKDGK